MIKNPPLKLIILGMCVLALSSSAVVFAQEKGSMKSDQEAEMSPEQVVMMAKWREYSTPAEGHAILSPLVGNWSYTMKHWMNAKAPVEESTGDSQSVWIMGGRFVEEKVSGMSMGQPFNGTSIMGYNNGTGLYSSFWFDNMSTGVMLTEGVYDAQAKTISSAGKFFCPFRGETVYRSVLTITDENSHAYEMYMTELDGEEFLAMQILYTRQ